jgi:NhaP-type Na+/H+ or K+/H+ antiporter
LLRGQEQGCYFDGNSPRVTACFKKRKIIYPEAVDSFLCFVVIFVTLVCAGILPPLLIRLLKVKPSGNEDKEEKRAAIVFRQSTLHFIDHEFNPKPEPVIIKELKLKI